MSLVIRSSISLPLVGIVVIGAPGARDQGILCDDETPPGKVFAAGAGLVMNRDLAWLGALHVLLFVDKLKGLRRQQARSARATFPADPRYSRRGQTSLSGWMVR